MFFIHAHKVYSATYDAVQKTYPGVQATFNADGSYTMSRLAEGLAELPPGVCLLSVTELRAKLPAPVVTAMQEPVMSQAKNPAAKSPK